MLSGQKCDELDWLGFRLQAVEIETSGACQVHVRVNGFRVTSKIFLSALPSAQELETVLVRFDVSLDKDGCLGVINALRELYRGPLLVLRASDNITYQGRNGALRRFEEDFGLYRVDNFVYIFNPWEPCL